MEAFSINMSPFFQWLLKTTIQGSVLICLILLLKAVLRQKLLIRWHYYLWLLLLVRLALPWSPQSRISMFNLMPQSGSMQRTEPVVVSEGSSDSIALSSEGTSDINQAGSANDKATGTNAEHSESMATSELVAETVIVDSDRPPSVVTESIPEISSGFIDVLPLIWFIGALVLAGYISLRNIVLWRAVKSERQVTDQNILELLEDCKMQMRIQTVVGVVVTDKVKSPALFGYIRPRLLLPQGLLEGLDLDELQYVFLHELAHLRRRDIYLGWIVSLLQVLHWFNPLIWFALRRMRTDQELACDALALSTMSAEEPTRYGRTLVNLFEKFTQVNYVPSIAGILEDKSQLERRIKMITRFKKNSYRWSPLAATLIIILGCVSLPDAINTKASQILAAESAPPIVLKRVWADADGNLEGATSPDGRYLSYVDWDTGDLAVYEIATGKKRRLTNKGTWNESKEFAEFSKWSPDSRQIVYDWYNKDDFIELRIVGLDGSRSRVLYRNEEVEWAQVYDWSPDGEQILACFSRKGGSKQIVLISIADGSERILKTLDSKWPGKISFSPDGCYIVYDLPSKKDSLSSDIFVLSIDENREVPLIEHPASDRVLGWAPDGKHILFVSDRTGSPDIWVIGVTDGNAQGVPKLVKRGEGPFSPVGLGFTRDGSFYYGHRQNRTDVYIAEIDPVTGKIIASPRETINRFMESNGTPAYSPDGKYLAYVSRRPPMPMRYTTNPIGNVLCVRSLETGEEREFRPELDEFGWPRWSPDGCSVLVVAWNKNGHMGYYDIDTQTGNLKPILRTEGKNLFGGHDWSPDGKTIYFGRLGRESERYRLCVRDLETGTEKVLYGSNDRFDISLSPDGRRLALLFISKEKQSLNVIPATGGELRELCGFKKEDGFRFGRNCSMTWTADGKYILYTEVPGTSPQSTRRRLDSVFSQDLIVDPNTQLEFRKVRGITGSKDVISMTYHGTHVDTSPNGRFLLYMNYIIPLADGNPRKLTNGDLELGRVRWSPDGTMIAFYSDGGIWVMPISQETGEATGPAKRLVDGEYWYQFSVQWSPDSKKLVYQGPNFNLHVVSIRDGTTSQITTGNTTRKIQGGWSPDGRWIAYNQDDDSIWVIPSEGGQPRKLADVTGRGIPHWSPDGQWVLCQWNSLLRFIRFSDGLIADVTVPKEVGAFISWSPDNVTMLFYKPSYGWRDSLRVISASGGEPILPDVSSTGNPMWTPDGRFIFTWSEYEDRYLYWVTPFGAGAASPYPLLLDRPYGYVPGLTTYAQESLLSPSKEKLLFTAHTDSGQLEYWVAPISALRGTSTGPAVKVFDKGPFEPDACWSPDESKIAIMYEGDLWIAKTNGSPAVKFTDTADREVVGRAWSPDGNVISWISRDPNSGQSALQTRRPSDDRGSLISSTRLN